MVRHVKCLTSLYMIFDVEKKLHVKIVALDVKFYFTHDIFLHLTQFHLILCPRRTALRAALISMHEI